MCPVQVEFGGSNESNFTVDSSVTIAFAGHLIHVAGHIEGGTVTIPLGAAKDLGVDGKIALRTGSRLELKANKGKDNLVMVGRK